MYDPKIQLRSQLTPNQTALLCIGQEHAVLRKLQMSAEMIAETVIDTVFPPRCAGCGRRGVWVCQRCFETIARLGGTMCPRCGRPIDVCSCSTLPLALDFVYSAAWYEGWLRQAIHAFKYEGEFDRARHLSELIRPLIDGCDRDVVMVPVPLHPDRERSRGFNQAQRIANELAARTGRSVETVLSRTVATQQQVRLSGAERANNVRNAFTVPDPSTVVGRHFVLIDDVMTTGSTLGECAGALKRAGAILVGAVTVARDR